MDSRATGDGDAIRRRRSCTSCARRFTTLEGTSLLVVKRSGVVEAFNRDKVVRGVRRALGGRAVAEDALALLAQRVEERLRAGGAAEVTGHQVGLGVLDPLRVLDEVAYLRFASVHHGFGGLADFETEIAALRTMTTSAVGSAIAPMATP